MLLSRNRQYLLGTSLQDLGAVFLAAATICGCYVSPSDASDDTQATGVTETDTQWQTSTNGNSNTTDGSHNTTSTITADWSQVTSNTASSGTTDSDGATDTASSSATPESSNDTIASSDTTTDPNDTSTATSSMSTTSSTTSKDSTEDEVDPRCNEFDRTKIADSVSVCTLNNLPGAAEANALASKGWLDGGDRKDSQILQCPNPSQGDGRTGSWSWYPTDTEPLPLSIVNDPSQSSADGKTIRYAGNGATNVWRGAALAFLGRTGGGTCYDISGYKGIRFSIWGGIDGFDWLTFSIITAETQPRDFGGDWPGDAKGHYQVAIPVTSQRSVHELLWENFTPPGGMDDETSLALTKAQAIEWSPPYETQDWEVFIDDIELF